MELYNKCGGYRRLDSYVMSSLVQLETLAFCRAFLNRMNDPCGRQFDQMTQAARSGVKNLVEGQERMKTSVSDCIRLVDVGRASLCELRDDLTTWLMDHGQAPWRQDSDEAKAVFAVRFDPVAYGEDLNHDSCVRILAERKKFAPWFGSAESCVRANALLVLINRAVHMIDKQMESMDTKFREDGGFHEKMTAVRVEAKKKTREPVNDDAPRCPECGQPMRLRESKNGKFWGCSAYPTCRGTRRVE